MDGVADPLPVHPGVGVLLEQQHRHQPGLPVVAVDNVWAAIVFEQEFQRGLAETRFDGRPLRSVSDRMREDGGFMRVYWSGAWYFLAADARLRLQSGGRLSLDQALARLNQCCAEDRLSVPEMVSRLDEMNRVELFGSLYDEVAASTTVPPFAGVFASLGIESIDGQVKLQETGPGARVRKAIAAVAGPTL